MTEPVSIRTKNPGAMWPGAIATQFGSVSHENLKDGNQAAIFPTFEQGAAAQFALWAGSGYVGKTLAAAIKKWSGGNSSPEYAAFLKRHVPSLDMDTVITRSLLASDQGRAFMKAQAQWEAGKPYPMTDAQWQKAQALAFGMPKPLPPPPDIEPVHPAIKPAASAGGFFVALSAMVKTGAPFWACLSIAFIVAVAVYLIIHNRSK